MIRLPLRSTRTDTLFPYTTLFRSLLRVLGELGFLIGAAARNPGEEPVLLGLLHPPLERAVAHLLVADELDVAHLDLRPLGHVEDDRSEEHTSELQSLMRISYAVFCLKKKK